MTDSTAVFHKVDEAFRSSVFYLNPDSSRAVTDSPTLWVDSPIHKILIAVGVLLFIANLKNLYHCLPASLKACLRGKAGIVVETRLSLKKTRNSSAFISLFIICIIFLRLGYISYAVVYLVSREALFLLARIKNKTVELKYAHSYILNYYIPLAIILFATYSVMSLCGITDNASATVLLYVTGAFWIMFLHKVGVFFKFFCNSFSSFLYLCALEILPVALSIIWVR